MRIAILSRNKKLHSIRRLLHEAHRLGVKCDVIDPLECQLVVEGRTRRIRVGHEDLPHYDAILPRIGASVTDYGLAVVKHFETMGSRIVNGSRAIAESRDKMRSLQVLSEARLRVPTTVLCRGSRALKPALETVGGTPVVLKVLRGTQGVGVMLLQSPVGVESVMDTLHTLEEDVIIQEYLKEGAGRDYRAFVVGGQLVAAMMRKAARGEFRSNIHRGGEGMPVKFPPSYKRAALRACQVLGLTVAGVDLMESPEGPTIIEVNSSPGVEGIEKATRRNIAQLIMKQVVAEARKSVRKHAKKKPRRAKRAPARRGRRR